MAIELCRVSRAVPVRLHTTFSSDIFSRSIYQNYKCAVAGKKNLDSRPSNREENCRIISLERRERGPPMKREAASLITSDLRARPESFRSYSRLISPRFADTDKRALFVIISYSRADFYTFAHKRVYNASNFRDVKQEGLECRSR